MLLVVVCFGLLGFALRCFACVVFFSYVLFGKALQEGGETLGLTGLLTTQPSRLVGTQRISIRVNLS